MCMCYSTSQEGEIIGFLSGENRHLTLTAIGHTLVIAGFSPHCVFGKVSSHTDYDDVLWSSQYSQMKGGITKFEVPSTL